MTEQLPERYKGSIVSFRNDRMGARLLCLFNTIRIAGDYDLPYYFTWMTHGRSSEEMKHPTEIFDETYFNAHFVSHEEFRHVDAVAHDLAILPTTVDSSYITDIIAKQGILKCMGSDLVVLPWETETDVAPRYAAAIDKLVFSSAIQDAIKAVDATLKDASTAFHIRRGDIIYDVIASNQLWSNKYIPREFYEVLGKQLTADPDHKILVFSDEPAEITRLQAMSPQIMVPDDILPTGLTLAQRDFMELYTMSRCSQIIGPPGSGFSMAAALIGHCPILDVTIQLDDAGKAEALELLVKRLTERSPLFLSDGDIGQSLPFACDYLNDAGRKQEALDLLTSYYESGFCKLFFYKMLLDQQHLCGQFRAYPSVLKSLETTDLDRALPARVERQMSELARISSLLAANDGDRAAVQHQIAMSFWYAGGNRLAYNTLSALLSHNLIDQSTFALPFDGAVIRPLPPTLPARPGTEGIPQAESHVALAIPYDMIARDWHPFMAKTLPRAFHSKAGTARALELLIPQFGRVMSGGSLASAQGLYASAMEDHETALGLHKKALQAQSDHPLFLKRMAGTMQAIDPQDPVARILFEHAAAMAPDQPMYHAELAECMYQQGAKDEAIALMSDIVQRPGILPEIPFMAARMIRQIDRKDSRSLPLIEQALSIAPLVRRYMMLRVNMLVELGHVEEAKYALDQVVDRYGESGDVKGVRARAPFLDASDAAQT